MWIVVMRFVTARVAVVMKFANFSTRSITCFTMHLPGVSLTNIPFIARGQMMMQQTMGK